MLELDETLAAIGGGSLLVFGVISAFPVVVHAAACLVGGAFFFLLPHLYFSPVVEYLKHSVLELETTLGPSFVLDGAHSLLLDQTGVFALQLYGVAAMLVGVLTFLAQRPSATKAALVMSHLAVAYAVSMTIMYEPDIRLNVRLLGADPPVLSIKTIWAALHVALAILLGLGLAVGTSEPPSPKRARHHTRQEGSAATQVAGYDDALAYEDGGEL